jgi:Carboxypeptidase regulatory-like domain
MSARPGVNHRSPSCAIRLLLTQFVLLAIFFGPTSAHAQVLYGSLTGTVTDSAGAVIPNAAVTVTNQGTGEVRATKSDAQGNYELLDVLPGAYAISVQVPAFAGFTQQNIPMEVNRQVRVDVKLQPASVSTQVTVTDAPAELQTGTAEVNSEIDQTEINALPLTSSQGRSYQALYTVIPGAAAVQEKNSTASNPSRSMSVNVNGASYNGNTTRIDGAVNYYGWLPYLIAYVPPADSIENVSFTTNAFNAEQGQAGGATIKVTTKSGTRNFHGSAWWYYQDGTLNAKPYTTPSTQAVPKNIFDQFGFNVGGPIFIPKILTGKKKLFFFENFERTTRRQLISGDLSVPDTNMIGGNFSEAASQVTLYDPQPTAPNWASTVDATVCPNPTSASNITNGYLNYPCRPSFTNEYAETGDAVNTIPSSRIASAAATMIANLQPLAAKVGMSGQPAANFSSFLANDVFGTGTLAYNRNTSDSKINYIPNDSTQIFGKYSIEPFTVDDPQELGNAGGGTFDGGQPGSSKGRIQNVGMGMSHIISPTLVVDADFGYTRQVTGAQSDIDAKLGDYGTGVLHIPGTNGVGQNYIGQPAFAFLNSNNTATFNSLGNSNGANPFLFRDNQFTGDVNLSWVKHTHSLKFGFTYYHFDLNHFQPTSGANITFRAAASSSSAA